MEESLIYLIWILWKQKFYSKFSRGVHCRLFEKWGGPLLHGPFFLKKNGGLKHFLPSISEKVWGASPAPGPLGNYIPVDYSRISMASLSLLEFSLHQSLHTKKQMMLTRCFHFFKRLQEFGSKIDWTRFCNLNSRVRSLVRNFNPRVPQHTALFYSC